MEEKTNQLVLETRGISKSFFDPVETKVLKNVSFEVQKGTFCSIIGKSGCGKSTLLYILSTMDTDFEGELFLDGRSMRGLSNLELAKVRNEKIGVGRMQDHHANRIVFGQGASELRHLLEHLAIEEIDLAVIEGHARDAAGDGNSHALALAVVHGVSVWGSKQTP